MSTPQASSRARESLRRLGDRLGRQPHLTAVRDGVVAALPLVLIGSTFLLLAQPPLRVLQEWAAPYLPTLIVPYRMLGGLIALYVCFGTARSLARQRGMDELGTALVAVASFFVALGPVQLEAGGWGVAGARLGAGGLFGALAIALGSVELQRLVAASNLTIRLPPSAPDAIGKSFASIVPGFASVTGCWLVVHVAGFDLVAVLELLVKPLVGVSDSLPGVLALCLVDSAMWLIGLHPLALLAPVKPLWLAMLTENMEVAAAGGLPPHIATREFFLWFVWQGGSGGTLAAALLLLRARSSTLKAVGRLGFVPALFNVNEPILFGLPVVMNPRLAVPFVAAPLVSATTTWLAMSAGWVARPRLDVLWTLPAPVGAFLATGGDAAAVVLQLGNLALAAAIWWPFLRAWDRALLAREVPEEAPLAGSLAA
ncbi:PTS sugar transporter subunit IIC [Vulgatibacter sp.]|uniref:PTS sugar transporter subunit IIC n=1 Tax=Vulgatibacter sp. TaxID=1971226 RepID=UPI003567ACC4